MRKRADKETSLSSSFILPLCNCRKRAKLDIPFSPLPRINIIQSILAFVYQHVLQNQHSLLCTLAHSVHHQHTPAQRNTKCNRFSTLSFADVVDASSNKTGQKVPCLPEHSIPKECSMPSSKHLGDMV